MTIRTQNNACQEKNKFFLTEQGNIFNEQLDRYIVSPVTGKADLLAIHIYVTARSWFKPKKQTEDNKVTYISKLNTDGWRTSLDYFSKKHKCSKETIRRKLVFLEELGLLTRDYRQEYRYGQLITNCLYILVWKETPLFYSEFGLEKNSLIKNATPQKCEHAAKMVRGGIHKNVDLYISNNNNTYIKAIDLDRAEIKKEFLEKETTHNISNSNVVAFKPKGRKPMSEYPEFTPNELEDIRVASGREYSTKNVEQITNNMRKKRANQSFDTRQMLFNYTVKWVKEEKTEISLLNRPGFVFISSEEYRNHKAEEAKELAKIHHDKYRTPPSTENTATSIHSVPANIAEPPPPIVQEETPIEKIEQAIDSSVDLEQRRRLINLWGKVRAEFRAHRITSQQENLYFSNIKITEENNQIFLKHNETFYQLKLENDYCRIIDESFQAHGYQLIKLWKEPKKGFIFEPIKEEEKKGYGTKR